MEGLVGRTLLIYLMNGSSINLLNISIKSLPLRIIDMTRNFHRFELQIKRTSPTVSRTTNRLLIIISLITGAMHEEQGKMILYHAKYHQIVCRWS